MDVSVGIDSIVHASVVHVSGVHVSVESVQGFAVPPCFSVCVGCCCKCNDILMA